MINFDAIESRLPEYKAAFQSAKPFPHLAIDGLCDPVALNRLVDLIPDPVSENIAQSRDYVFAKNKFEKSKFRGIAPEFEEIHADLVSARFQKILREVTGEDVFVDEEFHGGGLHQGGPDSFLDMHVDFNHHPLHKNWFRNLNILVYLNRDWKKEYHGELKLRHLEGNGQTTLVEPLFNRCVIMPTRDFTLHGYDKISFPAGQYRRSLATYAYTLTDHVVDTADRSTVWYPEQSSLWKRTLGKSWPTLVKIKNRFFGSATAKNA